MKRSKTLNEYAEFVAKVHNYIDNSGLELTEALKKAIEDCVKSNILREFLEKHGGEVVSILYREQSLDDAKEVWEEEKAEKIAEKMIKRGTPLDIIAEDTELTIEKVRELNTRLKQQNKI